MNLKYSVEWKMFRHVSSSYMFHLYIVNWEMVVEWCCGSGSYIGVFILWKFIEPYIGSCVL